MATAIRLTQLLLLFVVLLSERGNEARYAEPSFCPEDCYSHAILPTCGSDGQLYLNECDLRQQNCRSSFKDNVQPVSWSFCASRSCLHACTRELDPVCGEDGFVGSNPCTFLWYHACGKKKPIAQRPASFCLKKLCPFSCGPQDIPCRTAFDRCRFSYGL